MSSGRALSAYLVIALVMTWPLVAGIASDVPGDLGDSLLNMWILGWGAEYVPRLLTGQASLNEYWNANIFHPEPLALAFSEHLFGEALQILPVYWLTGNLILCYNLLFLSSFVLSGWGMFLLVRDLLTTQADDRHLKSEAWGAVAAFIAGLVFAFLPFRIAQVAHIQSLQAQWMPLALYGFRRYVTSGRYRPLAGGTAALLMQNWSNGYYLIFFAPFVPLFVVHQMWAAHRLRDIRLWAGFIVAALVVAIGTWPFLSLYLEGQRVHAFERPLGEVIRFSADVYSYLTAPEALRLWGNVMQAYPKPEGELFFGLIPWLLFVIGLVFGVRRVSRAGTMSPGARILLAIIAVQTVGFAAIVFTGGFITSLGGFPVRATNPTRILIGIGVVTILLLVVSRMARERARIAARSPLFLCGVLAVVAVLLSLGPMPQSHGRPLPDLAVYRVLYEHVPGFDGLRVPARYAMIAAVFLTVVAGYGVTALLAWRAPKVVATAIAVVFLIEVAFVPMTVNATWGDGAITPPARVEPASSAPAVYHTLAEMPDATVVAEFPFGDPAWELRYVYYSTVHWKRLLNGYSGGFPQAYQARVALLQRVRENPDAAWRALRDAGTTHVVVHQRAMTPAEATVITQWLNDHFAVEIARFDGDLLFDVSGVWPPR